MENYADIYTWKKFHNDGNQKITSAVLTIASFDFGLIFAIVRRFFLPVVSDPSTTATSYFASKKLALFHIAMRYARMATYSHYYQVYTNPDFVEGEEEG